MATCVFVRAVKGLSVAILTPPAADGAAERCPHGTPSSLSTTRLPWGAWGTTGAEGALAFHHPEAGARCRYGEFGRCFL